MAPNWLISLIGACLVALGPFCANEAAARVIVREKTRYYDVSGRDGRELYQQMIRKGPRIGGQRNFIATTNLEFDYRNIRSDVVGQACVILDVDVILSITYRMPRWRGEASASPRLRKAWAEFVNFTWRHERQHARIAREFVDEMLAALKSVRGDLRRQCADMGPKLDRLAERIITRHNERQVAFDASPLGLGGQNFKYDERLARAD